MNADKWLVITQQWEIVNSTSPLPISSSQFKQELLVLMNDSKNNLWATRILNKINKLLDATTVDKYWNVIEDNEAQLKALKLLLQLQWIDSWPKVINLFNFPSQNENIRY